MDVDKSKDTPKYTLPEEVIDTGQKTLDSIDNLLEEEFSIEESFFWIFQRWIWGVLKIVSVLGIIVFFVWIIWIPEKDLKNPNITIPEKIIPRPNTGKTPEIPTTSPSATSSTRDILLATQWNEKIKNAQIQRLNNLPANGLFWVKQATAFFDIPAKLFVDGDSPQIRQKKIESTLQEIEKLLEKSQEFKKNFNAQIEEFSQNISKRKAIANQESKTITAAFLRSDAASAEQSLANKIEAEQYIAIFTNEMKWFKTVLFEIEKYDGGLKSFHENILANKAALIQNIQVVNFPNDPFSRTISPSEWRETGE